MKSKKAESKQKKMIGEYFMTFNGRGVEFLENISTLEMIT